MDETGNIDTRDLVNNGQPLSKLDILKSIANGWAGKGAQVAASPYHMMEAFIKHGYSPGTNDVQGVQNAANVGLATMGAGTQFARPQNSVGMFGGVKSKTANLDNLELAKAFEKEGMPNEEIIKRVNWGRGKDGQWRYLLPGGGSSQVLYPGHIGYNKPTRLPDVLDYPQLYKAYPELQDVAMKGGAPAGSGAYHSATSKYDPAFISTHPQAFMPTPYPEARGAQQFESKKLLAHEGQHAIQDIEGFNLGFHPKLVGESPMLQEKYAPAINKEREELIRLYESGYFSRPKGMDVDKTALYNALQRVGQDAYKRNAGEVEARNAGRLINISDERKRIYGWQGYEDVPREDQLLDNYKEVMEAIRRSKGGQ